MDIIKSKAIIEAILFASGKEVSINDLVLALELNAQDIENIIENMKSEYDEQQRGIEIIKVDDSYQLCTKKEYYEYIYPIFDKRGKPNLSSAALESLSIIAYNPEITKAEIESIRGVNSDATIYKLLEYNLIEYAGKSDAPGKPMMYKTTPYFLKIFGIKALEELPALPKYKIDENEQIVLDDTLPLPEREEVVEKQENIEETN